MHACLDFIVKHLQRHLPYFEFDAIQDVAESLSSCRQPDSHAGTGDSNSSMAWLIPQPAAVESSSLCAGQNSSTVTASQSTHIHVQQPPEHAHNSNPMGNVSADCISLGAPGIRAATVWRHSEAKQTTAREHYHSACAILCLTSSHQVQRTRIRACRLDPYSCTCDCVIQHAPPKSLYNPVESCLRLSMKYRSSRGLSGLL